jgi:hypothetical protein
MTKLLSRYYLVPLLVLLAVWSGWFIYQSSFELNGERYYSLFDDAMISMTYAKNLTQGHGLNWAKFGEPVEGFSSPLWTFIMVPFQLLPIAWSKVSLAFAIFCAFILAANVVLLDRILQKRLGIDAWIPRLAATFALAFLYPLNYWSLVGMECGPQVLIFLLGLDQFLAFEQGRDTNHLWRLGMVLAAAMLLRMDMVFMVVWTLVFLAPWLLRNRLAALKFFLIAGLPMALYLVFRLFYFHDLFPNTYYLKLYKIPLDLRLARAWMHFTVWAKPLWLVWYLLPLMMIPLWRNKAMWLSIVLIATYLAYNLYVGGDAWEGGDIGANRFTIITMPFALVIFAAGGYAWGQRLRGIAGRIVQHALPAAACLLLLGLVNGVLFVPNQKAHWDRLMVAKQPYNSLYQKWNTKKALLMNDFLGTANRAACVQAGDIGYFANCELVDLMGYNGRKIARMPAYRDLSDIPLAMYAPGHVKMDYRYTIGEMSPDHIVDTWITWDSPWQKPFDSLLVAGHYVPDMRGGWSKVGFRRRDK